MCYILHSLTAYLLFPLLYFYLFLPTQSTPYDVNIHIYTIKKRFVSFQLH